MITMQSRYEGTMLGLAVGDALGWPVEFMSLAEIRHRYGPDGITALVSSRSHPVATFTDDTQMTLAMTRAILSSGRAEEKVFLVEVAREFVAWSRSQENDRGPGITCMSACSELARDLKWRAMGHNNSKGCGTAMRTAPIGLAWHGDEDRIARLAAETSLLTHGHSAATAGAVATALLVNWALDTLEPREMLRRIVERTQPICSEFASKLEQVQAVLDRDPESAYEVLGCAWVAEEAVACALYAFLRSVYDYRKTVLTAVNMEGDSDSVGCIAGAISGAYNGALAIPASWRKSVEKASYLVDLALRLLDFAEEQA